jgi:pyruvate dehydrogenase E1 component
MDLCWAAGDQRARGFLIGGTAGRTTLNGEGLQHEDGHSLVLSSLIPNCLSYDPTFSFEIAVIMREGMRRMYQEQEDVFYYITVMNENYEHPEMPAGAEADILKGMYLLRRGQSSDSNPPAPRVQLLGSGTIFREVIAAAELLKNDWGVDADLWGCPSFTELARDGLDVQRWNMLNPLAKPRDVARRDVPRRYARADRRRHRLRAHVRRPDSPFINRRYVTLGTDGFGRSDTREKLRHFFEVDRRWVTVAALKALADDGTIERDKVARSDRPLRHRRQQTQPDDGLREPSDESIDRSKVPDIGDYHRRAGDRPLRHRRRRRQGR